VATVKRKYFVANFIFSYGYMLFSFDSIYYPTFVMYEVSSSCMVLCLNTHFPYEVTLPSPTSLLVIHSAVDSLGCKCRQAEFFCHFHKHLLFFDVEEQK
jgi:hypothetical protein